MNTRTQLFQCLCHRDRQARTNDEKLDGFRGQMGHFLCRHFFMFGKTASLCKVTLHRHCRANSRSCNRIQMPEATLCAYARKTTLPLGPGRKMPNQAECQVIRLSDLQGIEPEIPNFFQMTLLYKKCRVSGAKLAASILFSKNYRGFSSSLISRLSQTIKNHVL